MEVSFDRRSLRVDGQRRFILSGALHYYRHPSPEVWRDRLRKIKALGLNAVDIYFYWSFHSPAEGEYDFSGPRDVARLMDLVEEEGLYLIARPGPYICSEVDGGGFPGWLLAKRHLNLRCKRDGKFVYDPEYMKYVRQWFEQIVPPIAQRPNLLLFQIENEYHFLPTPRGQLAHALKYFQTRFSPNFLFNLSMNPLVQKALLYLHRRAFSSPDYRNSNRYFQELYQTARQLGVTVPIFHNDVEMANNRFLDVDIAGIDTYPIKTFDHDWRGRGNPFAFVDLFEQGHEAHGKPCPLFIAEYQGGWFDLWGGKGYPYNRRHLGVDAMDLSCKTALAQGAALINFFMVAGGTSLGYEMSPDVYTSYDYGAPITEGGRVSARGRALKAFAEFVFRNEQELLEAEADPAITADDPYVFCRARKTAGGQRFVFLRNLTTITHRARLNLGATSADLPPVSMTVLVVDPDGQVKDRSDPYADANEDPLPPVVLPSLWPWHFALVNGPLGPAFDDHAWKQVPAGAPLDLDALGVHFGFVWYRGRFRGNLAGFRLDARHTWAAYLNGRLLKAYDNHRNRLANGEDFADTIQVQLPPGWCVAGENLLTILVESLGHNKGFLEDLHNPRGIVSLDTGAVPVAWRFRGGLLPGETGLVPKVDFSALKLGEEAEVPLPHSWPAEAQGVGVYQTSFPLELKGPDEPAVGVRISRAPEKANLYLNGHLVGRYWESVGPQKLFYLPPGFLNLKGQNHLAIAVWRWGRDSGLGPVALEVYP
ncbi:MAG: hypothetical protein A2V67_03370 [Deltaproteobacteria bacterium RBG_13_61_14]|nr:MAG: hypothetical protein A2V67_03370 [Deltaproteobacteria bacterium RBG_13_61_14]